jgi:hypothetical protein
MIAAAQAMFDPDVEEVLLRVYGVDPHSITLRRLWVLMQRLPAGAWKKDAGPGSWTETDYLLANVIDAVNQVSWVVAQSNSKRKVPVPKPVERPGQRRKKDGWGEFASALAQMDGE